MKSITYYEGLAESDQKAMLAEATRTGGGYEGWTPYCLVCSTMRRMDEERYGFCCSNCGNMIGWDLIRVKESPLNQNVPLNLLKTVNRRYSCKNENE